MVVTIWERFEKQEDGTGAWVHNHIEDGYDDALITPTPKTPEQAKNWAGGVWCGWPGELIDGVVHRFSQSSE